MIRDISFKQEGKEVIKPFLFSYRAIKQLNKAGVSDSIEQLETAAYYGFYYGHLKQYNEQPSFTQETVEEWFDEDLSLIGKITEIIQEVMGDFEESSTGKKKALKVSR